MQGDGNTPSLTDGRGKLINLAYEKTLLLLRVGVWGIEPQPGEHVTTMLPKQNPPYLPTGRGKEIVVWMNYEKIRIISMAIPCFYQ